MEIGKVYTISACRRTGDRSYIGTLWRVTGMNETTVVVVSLDAALRPNDDYWHGKPHILDKREREFTPADHLVEVVYGKAAGDVGA
jgi:hypothetical protein